MLKAIDQTSTSIKEVEKTLEKYVEKDEDVALLRTMPGVGQILSATIRAWTSDIARFESYKEYASFCGLVPYVKQSNESEYYGHITRRGPKELRTAMVQVVMGFLRIQSKNIDWRIYQQYACWKENKSTGKAIVACARKISRIVYCMLKNREAFDPERMINNPQTQIAKAS